MNTISKQDFDTSTSHAVICLARGEWEGMTRDLSVEYVMALANACRRKATNEGKRFSGLINMLLVPDWSDKYEALVGVYQ